MSKKDNFQKRFDDIINELKVNSTFSPEALLKINDLYNEHEQLTADLKDARKETENDNTVILKLREVIRTCESKLEGIEEREAEVKEREKDALKLELLAENAETRRQDAYNLVQMVFKSPVYTEERTGSVPVARDGYVETHQTNETITKEVN